MVEVATNDRIYKEEDLFNKANDFLEKSTNRGNCGAAFNQSLFWAKAFIAAYNELQVQRRQVSTLIVNVRVLSEVIEIRQKGVSQE